MENEDNESGYEAGSEVSLPSSDISDSDSKKKKKPCEVCGSDANDNLLVTCLACRETREHTYCMKVLLSFVPPMWLCEECRSGTGPNRLVEVHNEAADHQNITSDSINHLSSPLVEDASSPMSMDTSPVEKQELPDLNLVPSDSESAN